MNRAHSVAKALGCATVVLMALLVVGGSCVQRTTEIDVVCGRSRAVYRLFWRLKVWETEAETPISSLYRAVVDPEPGSPEWRVCSSFEGVWDNRSPHYRYHGADWAGWKLTEVVRGAAFTDGARRTVLQVFFRLLREDEGCSVRVKEFITRLEKLSQEAAASGRTVGSDALPEVSDP